MELEPLRTAGLGTNVKCFFRHVTSWYVRGYVLSSPRLRKQVWAALLPVIPPPHRPRQNSLAGCSFDLCLVPDRNDFVAFLRCVDKVGPPLQHLSTLIRVQRTVVDACHAAHRMVKGLLYYMGSPSRLVQDG